MQDLQSIAGSTGFHFVSSGSGDHRGPPGYSSLSSPSVAAPPQPLRCPRCDSTNTKFCYYNNYNLSQPRHYCKSCRRYWTRGGVLRNIPVGGATRKNSSSSSKRSSKTQSKPASKTSTTSPVSGSSTSTSYHTPNPNPIPDPPHLEILEFGRPNSSQILDDIGRGTTSGELAADQAELTDLMLCQGDRIVDGGLTGVDLDPALFDLAVDPTAYWNQGQYWNHSHWGQTGADPSLYFP